MIASASGVRRASGALAPRTFTRWPYFSRSVTIASAVFAIDDRDQVWNDGTDFAIHPRDQIFVLELDLEPLAAAESFNDRAAEGKAPRVSRCTSMIFHRTTRCVTELAGLSVNAPNSEANGSCPGLAPQPDTAADGQRIGYPCRATRSPSPDGR